MKQGSVRNSEGILMWTFDGECLVRPRSGNPESSMEPTPEPSIEQTKQVHVFSRLWDMAAEGYTTVFFGEIDSTWRALQTWCEKGVKVAIYIWSMIFVLTAVTILRFKWVDIRGLPSMLIRVLLMQAWVLMLLLSFVMWFFFVRKMLFEPQHQAPQSGSERLKRFKEFWRRKLMREEEEKSQ